jgi:AraC family transcriptional regulator
MKDYSAHWVHLVKSALAAFATDQEAARRCLVDASALLERHTAGCPAVAQYPGASVRSGGLAPWQIKKSLAYIDAHLDSKIVVRDLAGLVGVCESHFSRAFKRTIGHAPMKYVCIKRVERVRKLIASGDQPLSEIASACGFADQSHLTRVFGQVVGVSPGLWRRCLGTPTPVQEPLTARVELLETIGRSA